MHSFVMSGNGFVYYPGTQSFKATCEELFCFKCLPQELEVRLDTTISHSHMRGD